MLILNWMFALFLAVGGLMASVRVLRDVIDDCNDGLGLEVAVSVHANAILIAFCTTVLGAHLIFHLTGVYR